MIAIFDILCFNRNMQFVLDIAYNQFDQNNFKKEFKF